MKYFLEEDVNIFMFAYMQELEIELIKNKEDIREIEFHSSEANIDTEFKLYIQNFILSNKNKLDVKNFNKKITFKFSQHEQIERQYSDFFNYEVKNVLLPEELVEEHLMYLSHSNQGRVYTHPDLLLEITDGSNLFYRTIELKSTKSNRIPGSSIQQIKPYEWVIFARLTKHDVHISTGLYINSITSRLQFPDRSPRPEVGFNHLNNWNAVNRKVSEQETLYILDETEERRKNELLYDWQEFLAKRWVNIVFETHTNNQVPWFHTNLRKFILLFLDKYDNLSHAEKREFKENIRKILS